MKGFSLFFETAKVTMKDVTNDAVRRVLSALPPRLKGRWLHLDQIHKILREGGFPLLPPHVLRNAMMGARGSLESAAERPRLAVGCVLSAYVRTKWTKHETKKEKERRP